MPGTATQPCRLETSPWALNPGSTRGHKPLLPWSPSTLLVGLGSFGIPGKHTPLLRPVLRFMFCSRQMVNGATTPNQFSCSWPCYQGKAFAGYSDHKQKSSFSLFAPCVVNLLAGREKQSVWLGRNILPGSLKGPAATNAACHFYLSYSALQIGFLIEAGKVPKLEWSTT